LKSSVEISISCWNHDHLQQTTQRLIAEEPLSIRVEGKPYAVIMRTPGDELAHAAGFCLAEGIIDHPDEISSLAMCDGGETNVVTVTVTAARRKNITGHLDRGGYISQTGCGLCGKQLISELFQAIRPITRAARLAPGEAMSRLNSLPEYQELRGKTRASHAAAIFDDQGTLLSLGEDVGRHNALDKAVGKLFLNRTLGSSSCVVMSSRISYELVQKAARAGIPIMIAVSRATHLAVELARTLNMSLASRSPDGGLFIYCGVQRMTDPFA
jgi:FdhD protein